MAWRQWGGGATGGLQARGRILHSFLAGTREQFASSAELLLRQVSDIWETTATITVCACAEASVKYYEFTGSLLSAKRIFETLYRNTMSIGSIFQILKPCSIVDYILYEIPWKILVTKISVWPILDNNWYNVLPDDLNSLSYVSCWL